MNKQHIYIASFRYGTACLFKAEVKKETPKTYMLTGDGQHLVGRLFFGIRRLLKDDRQLRSFETEFDALAYLSQKAERYAEKCRDELAKAVSQANQLSARFRKTSVDERQDNDAS